MGMRTNNKAVASKVDREEIEKSDVYKMMASR
jgi:hypothetical protein